jgi:ABC-type molybdate transport system substrate-binding protein
MKTAQSDLGCSGGLRPSACRFALLAVCWSFAIAASAAEVKVLSAEAFIPVVTAMAPVFEKRTGDKLVVVKDTAAGIAKRIRDGQNFDLAILPPAMLEALGKEDAVSVGSIIPLAKVVAGTQNGTVYAGAVSAWASDSPPALSLLILLASEDTQLVLKDKGMAAP